MSRMTAARLRAQADRRLTEAVADAMDQRANGWRTREIAVCMVDAAHVIADLRQMADQMEKAS